MKLHRWAGITLAWALATSPVTAVAEEQPSDPDAFSMVLFAQTCVNMLHQPAELTSLLDRIAVRREGEDAVPLLNHLPGKAWLTVHEERMYGFSLTDSGVCTLTVVAGNAEALIAEFEELGTSQPEHYTSSADTKEQEDGWEARGYTWHQPTENTGIYMRLLLNPAPTASIRALISAATVTTDEP